MTTSSSPLRIHHSSNVLALLAASGCVAALASCSSGTATARKPETFNSQPYAPGNRPQAQRMTPGPATTGGEATQTAEFAAPMPPTENTGLDASPQATPQSVANMQAPAPTLAQAPSGPQYVAGPQVLPQQAPPQQASAPGASPAPATAIIPRRVGKLDPFWIEATAEADRAIWAATDPMAVPVNGASDPRAISTGPLTQPGMQPMGEGAEGLMHVTFAPEGADFDPCVSRDNSVMVFASTQHRATSDIYLKSITGRTITQLTSDPAHDIMPAISPDGRRIAFCSNRNGNWDIFVMSVQGGQAVQLTSDPTQELHPSWSPDGSKIVFCRLGQMSGRWELWVMDAANAQSAEFIGFGMFPQWCPKSGTAMGGKDKILYQRSRERGGRAFSIWTIDYKPGDAGSPTEIASSTTAAYINANWSPDAQRIVFASVENPAQANASATQGTISELWMVNVDGTGRVNLTTGGKCMNLMPCWGSDNRIYFVSDRSGIPNVWAIGTDKAVQAATGFPSAPAKRDFANVPEGQSTPADR